MARSFRQGVGPDFFLGKEAVTGRLLLALLVPMVGCSGSNSSGGLTLPDLNPSGAKSWSEDNGSGTWGKFHIHGLSKPELVSVVSSGGGHPVRGGAQSIRIERREGECVGQDCVNQSERTEISEGLERNGDNTWYAWSIYHKDYVWLQNGVSPFEGQFKALSGPMVMQFVMDENRGMVVTFDHFEGWRPRPVVSKSQINNRWHDILVHAKWSSGEDGLIRIWANAQLKAERRARICRGFLLFRVGIYAPQINRAGSRPTQVVYVDELMRGPTCQSVSQFMACPAD